MMGRQKEKKHETPFSTNALGDIVHVEGEEKCWSSLQLLWIGDMDIPFILLQKMKIMQR